MTKIYLNNELVDLSAADEEKRLAAVEVEKLAKKVITDAATTRETLKASAKAKLISGEALTEDEVNTIVL